MLPLLLLFRVLNHPTPGSDKIKSWIETNFTSASRRSKTSVHLSRYCTPVQYMVYVPRCPAYANVQHLAGKTCTYLWPELVSSFCLGRLSIMFHLLTQIFPTVTRTTCISHRGTNVQPYWGKKEEARHSTRLPRWLQGVEARVLGCLPVTLADPAIECCHQRRQSTDESLPSFQLYHKKTCLPSVTSPLRANSSFWVFCTGLGYFQVILRTMNLVNQILIMYLWH